MFWRETLARYFNHQENDRNEEESIIERVTKERKRNKERIPEEDSEVIEGSKNKNKNY